MRMHLVLLALLAAATAGAQQPPPDTSAAKRPMDPENPTPFIILHRSDLKLADAQVTQIGNIGALLTMKLRPLQDSLDDLRPSPSSRSQARPTGPMTPEQRDSIIAVRRATARVLGEMHDAALNARAQSLAVLTPEQQKKLQSLSDMLAAESRMSKMQPIGQQAGPPGASSSGVGGRPY